MKALLLGSTGLVGRELLKLLINDPQVDQVYTIGRKIPEITNKKLTAFVVDLENLHELPEMDIDTVFIAFGTTMKTAGSKERQEKIDVEIPTRVMQLAKDKGVKSCAVVSALGVSLKSPFFYSRMKARLDENAKELHFDHLILAKPSVLDGERKEKRSGEKFSIIIGNLLGKTGLFNSYRPVKVQNVAASMIHQIKQGASGTEEIKNSEIPQLARKYFDSLK